MLDASPMPKSVLSSRERKKINCLGREFTAYLFVVEWIGIYKGKHWLLSLLDGDTISPPLGEEFHFLIMDRLLRDNRGAVIMKDPSFLICGEWIVETRNFSFLTSLLGHLYHLIMIIWPGGFNSRPGSVYFGMGGISLWADLLY